VVRKFLSAGPNGHAICGSSPTEIVGSNPAGGMDVCDCYALSSTGLCDKFITSLKESYRLWCVVVYDLETSERGGHGPRWAAAGKKFL